MEKIIKIDGKDVKFKSTGSAPLRYKMQFKRDFFADIAKLETIVTGDKATINFETFDLEVFYNIAWIYAKIADPTIPPPLEWLDTFEEFPLMEIIPQLLDIITASIGKINQKN